MLSLNEKLDICYNTGFDIHSLLNKTGNVLTKDLQNLVYMHVEGHAKAKIERIEEGRCSLREQIDFDPDEYEKKIDVDLKLLKNIFKKISAKNNKNN